MHLADHLRRTRLSETAFAAALTRRARAKGLAVEINQQRVNRWKRARQAPRSPYMELIFEETGGTVRADDWYALTGGAG